MAKKKGKVGKKTKKKKIVKKKASKADDDTQNQTSSSESQEIKLHDVWWATYRSLQPDASEDQGRRRDELLKKYLHQITHNSNVARRYNTVILYDDTRMVRSDIDRIYRAIKNCREQKPILLVLHSPGGYSSSAYLIGKLCREYAHGKFAIVVPRQAKSAATLLCCAADEIHMGSLSELGPIDPQLEGMPALGLKDAIGHISELVKEYPETTEMFAKYLSYSVQPMHLGYYERIAKSAMQYAERLLDTHKDNVNQAPNKIAKHLVYAYKDHGFVIDANEAQEIFGEKCVSTNTPEYLLGSDIYDALSILNNLADNLGYLFYLMGSIDDKPSFRKKN